jgi:hypothetical protein
VHVYDPTFFSQSSLKKGGGAYTCMRTRTQMVALTFTRPLSLSSSLSFSLSLSRARALSLSCALSLSHSLPRPPPYPPLSPSLSLARALALSSHTKNRVWGGGRYVFSFRSRLRKALWAPTPWGRSSSLFLDRSSVCNPRIIIVLPNMRSMHVRMCMCCT